MHFRITKFILAKSLMILSLESFAQSKYDPSTDSINQVLDLLEKEIMKSESLDKQDPEEKDTPEMGRETVKQRFRFSKPEKIQTIPREKSEIDSLRKQTSMLQSTIDTIESNISKLHRELISSSKQDTFIEIYASSPTESSLLRNMKIILDSVVLMDFIASPNSGSFGTSMPIFYGPIKPGSHRLEVSAIISPSIEQIQFASFSRTEIIKTFDIHLPLGTANHKFLIEISVPNNGEKATIQLRES